MLGQIHGILDNIMQQCGPGGLETLEFRTEQDVSYPTVITQLTYCSVLNSRFSNTSVVRCFVSYQSESTCQSGRIQNAAGPPRERWRRLLLLGWKFRGFSIFPSSDDSEVREQPRSFRTLPDQKSKNVSAGLPGGEAGGWDSSLGKEVGAEWEEERPADGGGCGSKGQHEDQQMYCTVLWKMHRKNRRLSAMVIRRICSWEESSSVGSSAPQYRSEDLKGTFWSPVTGENTKNIVFKTVFDPGQFTLKIADLVFCGPLPPLMLEWWWS